MRAMGELLLANTNLKHSPILQRLISVRGRGSSLVGPTGVTGLLLRLPM